MKDRELRKALREAGIIFEAQHATTMKVYTRLYARQDDYWKQRMAQAEAEINVVKNKLNALAKALGLEWATTPAVTGYTKIKQETRSRGPCVHIRK